MGPFYLKLQPVQLTGTGQNSSSRHCVSDWFSFLFSSQGSQRKLLGQDVEGGARDRLFRCSGLKDTLRMSRQTPDSYTNGKKNVQRRKHLSFDFVFCFFKIISAAEASVLLQRQPGVGCTCWNTWLNHKFMSHIWVINIDLYWSHLHSHTSPAFQTDSTFNHFIFLTLRVDIKSIKS